MTAPKMELRRPREAEPTQTGWYYGNADLPVRTVIPLYVQMRNGRPVVFDLGLKTFVSVKMFTWFGPVPTCTPSGSI